MRTIHKYPIEITAEQQVEMHYGKVLHVGVDNEGVPCLWVEVDTMLPPVKKMVYVVRTGGVVHSRATEHLGSFVHGKYVWHVYVESL